MSVLEKMKYLAVLLITKELTKYFVRSAWITTTYSNPNAT